MARPTDGPTARAERVTVRFTKSEIGAMDRRRATLSRSDYLRGLVVRDSKAAKTSRTFDANA